MLTREDFGDLLSERAGVRREKLDFHARLSADLGLDSFALLGLSGMMAELGIGFTERDWLAIETVDDLYGYYSDRVAGGEFVGSTAGSPTSTDLPTGQVPSVSDESDDGKPVPPQRVGNFFRLAPVLPSSVPFLYELAIAPDVGFRWRYRGAVPSYQQFESELWQGMLVQFMVESLETGQPAGHVICYNPDFALGHAYVGAAMVGSYGGSGIAVEPVALFTQYLFDVWPFRKLYFEMPEFNYRQFASVTGSALQVEGRLQGHEYYRGRRWDRLILAAYRDEGDGGDRVS